MNIKLKSLYYVNVQYSLTKMFRNYVYKLYSFNYSVAVLLMLFYKILFIDRCVVRGTTDRRCYEILQYLWFVFRCRSSIM